MGIVWPRYNLAKSCDSIEYIDHSIDVECHKLKKVNFKIIKFKNLKLNDNPEKDNLYIKGKHFIIFPDMPYYHALTDKFSQFEILNDFDTDIMPQFIVVDCYSPFPEITDYYKDIYELYKIDFREKMNAVQCATSFNLIIEEAYFIVDELRVVPKEVYLNKNSKLPPWYIEDAELGYSNPYNNINIAGGFYLVEEAEEYRDLEICFNIDDILRSGIEKFKYRIRKHIPVNSKKNFGVYISRIEANKAHMGKYLNLIEEWKLKHPGMQPEEILYKYYSDDKFSIQKFNNFKRYVEREHVLIEELQKLGFQIVDMESLTFLQQMSIIVNSERVISLSGSSMVNSFIADEDTRIYEICEPADFKFNFHWYFSPKKGCLYKKQDPLDCKGTPVWYRIAERNWVNEALKDFKVIDQNF